MMTTTAYDIAALPVTPHEIVRAAHDHEIVGAP
jgi:hypothetical protein